MFIFFLVKGNIRNVYCIQLHNTIHTIFGTFSFHLKNALIQNRSWRYKVLKVNRLRKFIFWPVLVLLFIHVLEQQQNKNYLLFNGKKVLCLTSSWVYFDILCLNKRWKNLFFFFMLNQRPCPLHYLSKQSI